MPDEDRIVGSAKEAGGRVQSAVGDAVGSDRHAVEGRFREAEGRGQNLHGQANDTVRSAAGTARDYAGDAYERGGDYLQHSHRQARAQIGDNPYTALLIAGAVGYALGFLLHTRR